MKLGGLMVRILRCTLAILIVMLFFWFVVLPKLVDRYIVKTYVSHHQVQIVATPTRQRLIKQAEAGDVHAARRLFWHYHHGIRNGKMSLKYREMLKRLGQEYNLVPLSREELLELKGGGESKSSSKAQEGIE